MKFSIIGLILSSVMLSSVAQLFLKFGMSDARITAALSAGSPAALAVAMTTNLAVAAGLLLYGLGAIVWLLVLGNSDVSYAYPFMGLAFIFTMFMAYFFLGEGLSVGRIVGTFVVAFGIVIVARS